MDELTFVFSADVDLVPMSRGIKDGGRYIVRLGVDAGVVGPMLGCAFRMSLGAGEERQGMRREGKRGAVFCRPLRCVSRRPFGRLLEPKVGISSGE